MSALRHAQFETATPQPRRAPVGAFLTLVRQSAREARCKSYIDLFGACAALSTNTDIASHAACEVLVRCLSQALGHRPTLLAPHETTTSFDEDWLTALARAVKTGDEPSATFLLYSRVPKHAHRNLIFLLQSVLDGFDRI